MILENEKVRKEKLYTVGFLIVSIIVFIIN